MPLMQSVGVPVYRSQYISSASGFPLVLTSPPIRASGNRAALSATVVNSTAIVPLSVDLIQTFDDGKTWKTTTATLLFAGGIDSQVVTLDAVQGSSLGVRMTIGGLNRTALVDATVVFTGQ